MRFRWAIFVVPHINIPKHQCEPIFFKPTDIPDWNFAIGWAIHVGANQTGSVFHAVGKVVK